MNNLNIEFKLDRIHCHDEGDGPGNAEPYLWTVFFKVDGDTCVVNTAGANGPFLQGVPTIVTTPGNHGNLGTSDVDEGDDVTVPSIIGEYRTLMKPIPLTTPILGIKEVGGMIGCIVVLMEEDNTSGDAIARGHEALDRSVRDNLTAVLGTLSITKPSPTEEDVQALSDAIGSAVKQSIKDGVSVLSWIAGFGNMDDQIGSAVFRFSHNELEAAAGSTIPFGRRWDNEGDWEIFGHIGATIVPRAEQDCCDELRAAVEKLQGELSEQSARIKAVEARVVRVQRDGIKNLQVAEMVKADKVLATQRARAR
jgi:hypothetical protein